jgi:tRNA 2-thiouridine synthesizing protein E
MIQWFVFLFGLSILDETIINKTNVSELLITIDNGSKGGLFMYDTVNLVRITSFNKEDVEARARKIGITLTEQHWDAINFAKNFYDYHENEELQVKDYNNAFKGKYADQGGLKYLYTLFPEGPVNMITQLAGIPAVKSVMNGSSGTVQ